MTTVRLCGLRGAELVARGIGSAPSRAPARRTTAQANSRKPPAPVSPR